MAHIPFYIRIQLQQESENLPGVRHVVKYLRDTYDGVFDARIGPDADIVVGNAKSEPWGQATPFFYGALNDLAMKDTLPESVALTCEVNVRQRKLFSHPIANITVEADGRTRTCRGVTQDPARLPQETLDRLLGQR